MDYYDALRAIARPIRATDMPRSLEPMRRLLAELGEPQKKFSSLVVTGSVGKGSTAHQIAALVQQTSPSTGLFTGPHLHSFRERFILNGTMISPEAFTSSLEEVLEAAEKTGLHYSTFELATALAMNWFAEQRVKLVVLEVGIGGRWDAVNTAPNTLAVITPIEGEHLAMLGGSLQTIAYHKAGVIQPGGNAVSAPQRPEVRAVLTNEAEFKNAHLVYSETPSLVAIRLLAEQGIIKPFNWPVELPQIHLPGRLEGVLVNGRKILIDGGHTRLAALRLRNSLADEKRVNLIVGMLRDKSARDFLNVFDEARFHITLTTAPGHRAAAPERLMEQAQFQHATIETQPELSTALELARNTTESVVVSGSLRMAAATREAFGLLTPNELDEARQTRSIFEGENYLKQL